jgi:hypothetical protein
MDRISDERLREMIEWVDSKKDTVFTLSRPGRRIVDDLDLALVELRERRAAEKEPKPEPYLADWTDLECPKCNHYSVCLDKFGYRCVIDGCGWTKDDHVKK